MPEPAADLARRDDALEWDDTRFAFFLTVGHGESERLLRADLADKPDPGSRWRYCEQHHSWEMSMRRLSGAEALAWAEAGPYV